MHNTKRIIWLSAAAVAVALGQTLPGAELQLAPEEAEERGADELTGSEVRSRDDRTLGTIKDFVIEPRTGKVVFAVVSSGGVLGIGDTLRIVPFEALKHAKGEDRFTTAVNENEWTNLPTISKEDFRKGIFNLTNAGQPEFGASWYGNAPPRTDAEPSGDAPGAKADFGRRYVRAAHVVEKAIEIAGEEAGEIDDIVLDFENATAMALVEMETALSGDEQEFLVPLSAFRIEGKDQDRIPTTLSRADFQRAEARKGQAVAVNQPADGGTFAQSHRFTGDGSRTGGATSATRQAHVAGPEPGASQDSPPPTGRTEQSTIPPGLQSAARAVREAWDAHSELAKADLQVTARDGYLLLKGTVPNADASRRASDVAERAVRGVEVRNEIRIQR